jgi:Uri superfamily endonuclease
MIDTTLKGSYILLIELPQICRITVGSLGEIKFARGFYAYVGSAMGGVQARVNYHLQLRKKARWHIDYLLKEGKIKEVIYTATKITLECKIAHKLAGHFQSFPAFGSSDCYCTSHLFFSKNFKGLRTKSVEIFRELLEGKEPLTENLR